MSSLRHVCPLLVALCVFTSSARAQDDVGGNNPQGWNKGKCFLGLNYGAPLKLAVSMAYGVKKDLGEHDVCLFVAPKVGFGGAKLDAGFARTFGTFGGGASVSGGILRTFGAPSHADRMSNYAGASLHVLPLLAVGLELGYYKRLGGTAGRGRESIIVWSAGIGY